MPVPIISPTLGRSDPVSSVKLFPRPSSEYLYIFFFFNDTATTEIYPLSLHDALPISACVLGGVRFTSSASTMFANIVLARSEEHTSELQSRPHLVCRLLLEKKKFRSVSDGNTPRSRARSKSGNSAVEVFISSLPTAGV